ncbi:hypothetical protein AB0E08_10895 [Streptomyces sp. NPDC048281]|uniref:hypothetical protein n=1 Tax=Streptomyces sp. NPDC048281 TaxID=3154715 RepID=UPI003427A02A
MTSTDTPGPASGTPGDGDAVTQALDHVNAEFDRALEELADMMATALANASDAGRRAHSAKALATVVPQLEQAERDLLTGNHGLKSMGGPDYGTYFVSRRLAWLEALPAAQRALYDAGRHGAPQVAATLLRFAMTTATAPRFRKGRGKRRGGSRRR